MKNFIIAVLVFALGGTVFYYQVLDGKSNSDESEVVEEEVDDLRAKLEEFKESSTVGEKPEESEEEVSEEEDDDEEEEKEVEVEEDTEEEVVEEEERAEHFITLTSPTNKAEVSSLPIVFTGKISEGATKLVVTAEGGGKMEPYKDVYTLKDFKAGDTTFTYRAKPEYENLAGGLNEYEFTAYFGDGETESAYISIYYEQ